MPYAMAPAKCGGERCGGREETASETDLVPQIEEGQQVDGTGSSHELNETLPRKYRAMCKTYA
jgi:hypothetical protein